MRQAEVQQKYEEIRKVSTTLADLITEFVKPMADKSEQGLLTMSYYEAIRRLEECLHRVSDCASYLHQHTAENVDAIVDKAFQDGSVKLADNPNAELKVVK
jgi:2-phosphoglycerate kinase